MSSTHKIINTMSDTDTKTPSLLERLERYIIQMAPHVADREGGRLITEATKRMLDMERELVQARRNSTEQSGAHAPEPRRHIPDEVGGIVSKLRAELEDAKAEIDRLKQAIEYSDDVNEAEAAIDADEKKALAAEVRRLRSVEKDWKHCWSLVPSVEGETVGQTLERECISMRYRAERAEAQVAALVAAGDALYAADEESFARWTAAKSGTRAETWPLNDGDEVLHAMANGTAPDTRDALIHLIAELRAVTSQCVGGPTLELVRKLIVKYDPESSGSIGPAPASKPTAEVPDPRDAALRNADEAIGSAIGVLNAIRGESQHCDSCHAFERATDWMNEWHGGDRVRVPIAAALSATPASVSAELDRLRVAEKQAQLDQQTAADIELAELRADKARLDWLLGKAKPGRERYHVCEGNFSFSWSGVNIGDLRAAIDAAKETDK